MNLEKVYDKEFSSLAHLNWLPWVGTNYHENKVLLIGESHYDDHDDWLIFKDATRNFVNNQGLNSQNPDFKNRKFFQQIEKTLLNESSSTFEQRERLWNNVAFYNLVQRLLPSIKDRPTDDDYDKGWLNFLDILTILKPSICIKYGYEGIGRLGYLLNNFEIDWKRDNIQEFFTKPYCINLTKDDYQVKIIFIHHPTGSFGFDFEKWFRHIKSNYPNVDALFS